MINLFFKCGEVMVYVPAHPHTSSDSVLVSPTQLYADLFGNANLNVEPSLSSLPQWRGNVGRNSNIDLAVLHTFSKLDGVVVCITSVRVSMPRYGQAYIFKEAEVSSTSFRIFRTVGCTEMIGGVDGVCEKGGGGAYPCNG